MVEKLNLSELSSELRTEVTLTKNETEQEGIPFFPDHAISEATVALLVLCLISFLCIFLPAGLGRVADPMRTPAGAKPGWYFLSLYAFLRFAPPVVGALTPVVGIVLLFFLPFLDREPERALGKRLLALSFCAVLLIVVISLTIMGYLA